MDKSRSAPWAENHTLTIIANFFPVTTTIFTELSFFCLRFRVKYMQIAGTIIEYNPMHCGHLYCLEQIRTQLGPDTAVIGVMSGNFVQRGDFAVVRKHARARAAAESGVDLVLELPLPWAVGSAERFADGGVQVLEKTGMVSWLAFGSECGDAARLTAAAACLESPEYEAHLRSALKSGRSYAACRQAALAEILGAEEAALLHSPNNLLGVEYCRALLRRNSGIRPVTVQRKGAGYHAAAAEDGIPSATMLRELLRTGAAADAAEQMAPAMRQAYLAEVRAGRAPVFREQSQRAMLARLRSMTAAEFAALDEGGEGLWNRLYDAAREAPSIETLLERAKTKRYAYSRLQRMVLWAYLGLTPGMFPVEVPYLRVLAANATGRMLLARMRKTAAVPLLTRPAAARQLPEEARRVFAWEARATDLYVLAYPELDAAEGGTEWKEGPAIL